MVDGPTNLPERRSIAAALHALGLPRRKPDEADTPPPSTFPMTPGAKAALRSDRAKRKREGS